MSKSKQSIRNVAARISAGLIAAVTGAHLSHAQDMTAGVVLREMPSKEFVAYVAGMIDGMAYARFRKDTIAAGGQKVETGMLCIRNWHHSNPKNILAIEDAFRKYTDYAPWVVLGVMIKKECGE